jgi:hypothetical protein
MEKYGLLQRKIKAKCSAYKFSEKVLREKHEKGGIRSGILREGRTWSLKSVNRLRREMASMDKIRILRTRLQLTF